MKDSVSETPIAKCADWAFFAPSVRLMGRISFFWKFVVTGVLFLAPLLFVLFHYVAGLTSQIEFSRREVDGARLLSHAQDLMRHVASARRTDRTLGEDELPLQPGRLTWFDRLEATADAMLAIEFELPPSDQIPRALQSFRDDLRLAREQLNAAESPDDVRLALIHKLQKLIVIIGNHSNLILDPDLDTYYLMDQTVLKLPERLAVLTKLDVQLNRAHARGNGLTQTERYELLQATEYLRKNVLESRQGIQFAVDNNPTGNLRPILMPTALADHSSTDSLLALLESFWLEADSNLGRLRDREPREACVTSGLALYLTAIDQLEMLIRNRIRGFESRKWYVLSLAVPAVTISIYLLCGTFLTITLVVRDMVRMTSGMSQGDFSRPLTVSSRDELGTVANLFNRVATQLHSAITVIEDDRVQLANRVAERTAELTAANTELIQASRFKSEFLASMSHELRTPLNGILGMNELLLNTELTERQRQFVQAASTSGKTLLQQINDILDLSKIEAGKMELDVHECRLEALVFDVADVYVHIAQQKGLSLHCHFDPAACMKVVCDDNRIRQVLVNLLGNAIKFTQAGEITLCAESRDWFDDQMTMRFSVTDTGRGIPEDRRGRLFAPFSQVENSTAREFGGTGLGLSICKQLVEMMGGKIGVESQLGVGSTFWFDLTLPIVAEDSVVSNRRNTVVSKRVLVVDGADRTHQQIVNCLQSWGCRTEQVDNLQQALEAVARAEVAGKPFAAVLSDCQLVAGDEYILLQELTGPTKPPVIGVGTDPDEKTIAYLRQLGVRNVLRAPIRPSSLFNALTSVFAIKSPTGVPDRKTDPIVNQLPNKFPAHVLVAEDNSINQLFIRELLAHFGCTCDIANNGDEALKALKYTRYDLILMDCQMPEMDGFAASREIRRRETADELAGRLPIIALTANALKGDRELCLEAGMDDYLSKPLQAVQLQMILAKYLANAAQSRLSGETKPLSRLPLHRDAGGTESQPKSGMDGTTGTNSERFEPKARSLAAISNSAKTVS